VAHALSLPAGPYHHTAWSLHIYDEHVETAHRLRTPPDEDYTRDQLPTGIGCWNESPDSIAGVAKNLLNPKYPALKERLTESEWWYAQRMRAAFRDAEVSVDET
jgi:hypothetical protein